MFDMTDIPCTPQSTGANVRLRFSLKTMLLFTALTAIFFSLWPLYVDWSTPAANPGFLLAQPRSPARRFSIDPPAPGLTPKQQTLLDFEAGKQLWANYAPRNDVEYNRWDTTPFRAVLFFQRAIDGNPEYAEAHYELADVFDYMGDRYNAIHHIDVAIRLQPTVDRYQRRGAKMRSAWRDYDAAFKAWWMGGRVGPRP